MAKSGSKEWYKDMYETAAGDLERANDALAKCLRVDTSLLGARQAQAVERFFSQATRYTNKAPGQIAAACIAHLAEGTRSVPVQGLIARLKRLKGLGL